MYVCSKAGLNSGSPGTCVTGERRRRKVPWVSSALTFPGTLTMAVSITRRSNKPPICVTAVACQYVHDNFYARLGYRTFARSAGSHIASSSLARADKIVEACTLMTFFPR